MFYSLFVVGQTGEKRTKIKKQKIEIINANSLEYDQNSKSRAKKLIGNVIFKQKDVYMYCDSAYFRPAINSLIAYSNVKIKQGNTLTLTGDSLHYNGDTKLADILGNIVMTTDEIQLKTDYLKYNLDSKMAYYNTGGTIQNLKNKSILTSESGRYFSDSQFFFFKNNVKYKAKSYTIITDTLKYHAASNTTYFLGPTHITSDSSSIFCKRGWSKLSEKISFFKDSVKMIQGSQEVRADSIFYNDSTKNAIAYNHVFISDTTQNLMISGDLAKFNNADSSSIITGNTEMQQYFDKDTLFLHADTLIAALDSTRKHNVLRSFYHVKFFKSDMQGICDSMVFSEADSSIKLFRNPIVWTQENQMTADSMRILKYDGEIKRIYLVKNSFISAVVDSTKYNQIKGRNMEGYFKKNSIYKIDVKKNGQTIYFPKDDKKDEYIGMNRVICSDMVIRIDSNKTKTISFHTEPSATLFPLSDVSTSQSKLEGFKWLIDKRPVRREDIFEWEE